MSGAIILPWTEPLLVTLKATIRQTEPQRLYRRDGSTYLERWYLHKNPSGGVYLHHFIRSDDDTPHDHPRRSVSLMLAGRYIEWIRNSDGTMRLERHAAGDVIFRRATTVHRIELPDGEDAWTLFIVGPRVRDWGFVCGGGAGRWVPWREFTGFAETGDSSTHGKGCE